MLTSGVLGALGAQLPADEGGDPNQGDKQEKTKKENKRKRQKNKNKKKKKDPNQGDRIVSYSMLFYSN